jgi:hypothetical protein
MRVDVFPSAPRSCLLGLLDMSIIGRISKLRVHLRAFHSGASPLLEIPRKNQLISERVPPKSNLHLFWNARIPGIPLALWNLECSQVVSSHGGLHQLQAFLLVNA